MGSNCTTVSYVWAQSVGKRTNSQISWYQKEWGGYANATTCPQDNNPTRRAFDQGRWRLESSAAWLPSTGWKTAARWCARGAALRWSSTRPDTAAQADGAVEPPVEDESVPGLLGTIFPSFSLAFSVQIDLHSKLSEFSIIGACVKFRQNSYWIQKFIRPFGNFSIEF